VNLYGSDQICDQPGGEIVDQYSPLGLLVLCGRQARSVSVYMHRRHAFHEAVLIVIDFQVATAFQFSRLNTVACCFLTSRASPSGPPTRSDTHVWKMIKLSVPNSRRCREARLMALPAETCGSRLSSEISIIRPCFAQMSCRNHMCFQPYRVNWFVEVLIRVIQRAVDISALYLS